MKKPVELYACLYAREFPAQALLRLKPDLHDKPFVVMTGDTPLQHVCSLNKKARTLGITHGMTQVEVDTFPSVIVLPRSPSTEELTKTILLECAGGFSHRVEECTIDGAFLCVIDIAGTRNLFGPPEALAQNLLARVKALGVTACIAVSSNFYTIDEGANSETAVVSSIRARGAATITVVAPLARGHAAGAQISGSGISLTTPLTRTHTDGAQVSDSVPTPGAPNQYSGRNH
jgi:protein ImuB